MIAVCYDRPLNLPEGLNFYTKPSLKGKQILKKESFIFLKIPQHPSFNSFWRRVNGSLTTGQYFDPWIAEALTKIDLKHQVIPSGIDLILCFGAVFKSECGYLIKALKRTDTGFVIVDVRMHDSVPENAYAGFVRGDLFSVTA